MIQPMAGAVKKPISSRVASQHVPRLQSRPDAADTMSDDPDSTSTEVEVSVLDRQWRDDLPSADRVARRAAETALRRAAAAELRRPNELSVVLADDARVRELNRDYRGRDAATNVLAFANLDDPAAASPGAPVLLGDVVLARQTLLREAAAQGKSPADHLSHLVVHGVLHLLGFDHQQDDEARCMENLEILVLADLGVSNPYVERPLPDAPVVVG